MVADRLGVAVLGAGAWGINHVRALTEERRAELRLVVDPDPAVAARVAAVAPGVAVVADVDRVLDDPTIAAVVIATPAVTHAALAQRALAAGKHVLVEKPMAMTAADAHAVAAAATRAGRVRTCAPAHSSAETMARCGAATSTVGWPCDSTRVPSR